jgi:hypothetical protein
MKKLICLLLGLTAICAAQTLPDHPIIVKRLVLKDQTQLLGALTAPVEIYRPTSNGFYRMTMYAAATGTQAVELCGAYLPNRSTLCAISNGYDESAVVSFFVQAGQPIGFFTSMYEGTLTGSYDLVIVLELLI